MEIATSLVSLLIVGSSLAAKGVLGELAKGLGKSLFEAIKLRLKENYDVKSLELLDEAEKNDAFRKAIESDIASKSILGDTELMDLASRLQTIISENGDNITTKYAIDIGLIKSGGNVSFGRVEGGIRGKKIRAKGDVSFEDIRGKSAGKN